MKTPSLLPLVIVSVALVLVGTSGVFAASPLQLTLALEPEETLPGIEVSLRVDVSNVSGGPVPFPRGLVLEVTPEGRPAFLTTVGIGRQGRYAVEMKERDGTPIVIPANGSKRLSFPAGPEAPWKFGRFWRQPGVYRVRVIADDGLLQPLNGDAFPLNAEFLVDPIISNPATLTIPVPTGADLEVYRMIAAADHWLWRDQIADAVWRSYPDSAYAAYLVRRSRDLEQQIAYFAQALDRNPRGAYGDWYRWSMAKELYVLSSRFVPDDLPRAFEHSERARKLLEEVIQRNVDPAAVIAARETLDAEGMSYEELKDYAQRLRDARRPFCERLVVQRVRDGIDATMSDPATSDPARKKLGDVLRHLDKFATEIAKTPPSMDSALAALKGAVMDLQGAVDDKVITADKGGEWIRAIVTAAELAAQKAIDAAAKDVAVNTAKLASARAKFEEARASVLKNDFKNAVSRFLDALNQAYDASKARAEGC